MSSSLDFRQTLEDNPYNGDVEEERFIKLAAYVHAIHLLV